MNHSLNGSLRGFGLVLAGVMALPMGAALAFEAPRLESSNAQLIARGGGGGVRAGGGGG
ncbi:MAG: hypothetical protein RLZZ268_1625, partial [Cyanobacteriota bacterium]